MKRIITVFFISIFLSCGVSFSQDYSLNSTKLNAHGSPGDFMLSTLVVNNASGSTITMHMQRIVKNLPANWTSCFCYPTCIGPLIDTLTFSIAPFSKDSIKPNYGTDPSTPGIGYITIRLYQEGFPNNIDTIAFSGNTLTSGINEDLLNAIAVFPNPVTDCLVVSNTSSAPISVTVFNSIGEIVAEKYFSNKKSLVSFSEFSEGYYFIQVQFNSSQVITKRILKSK